MTSKDAPEVSQGKSVQKEFRGQGRVKAVLSGTCVVLRGVNPSPDGSYPERTVFLSGIEAPRIQRSSRDKDPDQPFAWHSREFLRKLIIGKTVLFNVREVSGKSGSKSSYGDLFLNNDETQSVKSLVVAAGWAFVKGATNKDAKMHGDRQLLYDSQKEAEKAGRGMHEKGVNEEDRKRTVNYSPDTFQLYAKTKGKSVPVIIDYVRSGSTVSVEIVSGDLKHTVVNLTLCGVLCDRTAPVKGRGGGKGKKGGNEQKSSAVSAYARLAQFNVANLLLHRDMHMIVLGIDKNGNLYGSLTFPAYPDRDVAEFLLKKGLGKYLPWTGEMLPPKLTAKYRATETKAREAAVGRWGKGSKETNISVEKKMMPMKVMMVFSGDSFAVIDANSKETRLNLADIRTKRLARGRDKKESEPLAFEAKEWLRKKVVGQKMDIRFEYKRQDKKGGTQDFVSIGAGRSNIQLQLVQLGYAEVVQHSLVSSRSSNYVKLVEAEYQAKKLGKGIWAKNPVCHKYTDLTNRPSQRGGDKAADSREKERAEAMLPHLAGAHLRGHVEYVFSGSKFKVYIESKKLMMNVQLAGVEVPRWSAKNTTKYGADAHALARSLCLQKNVIIEIPKDDTRVVDRQGTFSAYIWTEKPKRSIACALLEQGLGKVFKRAAEAGGYLDQLMSAQEPAKSRRLRVWEGFDEEEKNRKAKRDAQRKKEAKEKNQKISVTEIVNTVSFFAQSVGDKNIETVRKGLSAIEGTTRPDDFNPEFGDIAACKFDGAWYRVCVEETDDDMGTCDVEYIDYGNKEHGIDLKSLMPLSEDLMKIPRLSKKYVLAAVQMPPEGSGWEDEGYTRLGNLIFQKEWDAEVLMQDKSGYHVSIKGDDQSTPVQGELLKDGLCRLQRKPDYSMKYLLNQFRKYQEEGVKNRMGCWEYGEISDEEEEDDRRRRR